jgi:hypothetical protein
MKYLARLCSLALLFLIFCCPANAQSDEVRKVTPAKKTPAENSEAAIALNARRAQARSLLISLASDARTFRDQQLRARSLARIADALWEVDAERGRELFRKAWDAAEVADREAKLRLDEEIRQQKARTGGGYAVNLPPNLRGEVLRLAARRNRALGEEFLEKLKAERQSEADAAKATKPTSSFGALPEGLSQRLNLAQQLLDIGDVERALQFAEPALGVVNMATVDFLAQLREKDANAADMRYAAMLANAEGSFQSDANTVSLLSSYIFTPRLYVTFSGGGTSSSQMTSTIVPVNVAPELQAAFFRTAFQVLSRPLAPPEQDQSTSGVDGKYLMIKRLLPLFEQYAPKEMTENMRAQMEALSPLLREGVRQRDDQWVRKGIRPEESLADQEQSMLDKIDHAKTSADRDSLYIQLAFYASGRGDVRARDFADKVEDSEVRQKLHAYIDPSLAMRAMEKKQPEQALELARTGDLTHLQRSWIMIEAAKLLAKSDRDKSLALIDDALAEARRIDGSDPDRARALFAVANALLVSDAARVWDATFDAIKAANSAEGFTGEDGRITLRFEGKGSRSIGSNSVADFDLAGIFGQLAGVDYDRAVELARSFQGEGPRAVATIAIARSVLEQKPKKVADKK